VTAVTEWRGKRGYARKLEMKDFSQAPFVVIWEVTQACDLACVHCRASAAPWRDPLELTTAEGFRLLDEIRAFGDPLVVFTGGDPRFGLKNIWTAG